MSYRHDTSYSRNCCRSINRSSKSSIPLICYLLRWRLDSILLNVPPTLVLRGGVGGCWTPTSRGSCVCPTPRPPTVTSVPTGLQIPHSNPRGFCSGACITSISSRPNTCLSDYTPLATINPGGIRCHIDGLVKVHHSHRREGLHAGGESTQYTWFYLQRGWGTSHQMQNR